MHGKGFTWNLPQGISPGSWAPTIGGVLTPCSNGYHLCELEGLGAWLGPEIHLVQWTGESIWKDEGLVRVVRRARIMRTYTAWTERAQRIFALDCVERIFMLDPVAWPGHSLLKSIAEVREMVAAGINMKDVICYLDEMANARAKLCHLFDADDGIRHRLVRQTAFLRMLASVDVSLFLRRLGEWLSNREQNSAREWLAARLLCCLEGRDWNPWTR